MTHRNRVDPAGEIVAESYRGDWMGNRGGPIELNTKRQQWASRHWIYCHLDFNSRKRVFRDPGRKYTELFFFDEAVALAAGHRPCGECQHHRLLEFKSFVGTTSKAPVVDEIDGILHSQRRGPADLVPVRALPSGTFVDVNGPVLLWEEQAFRWRSSGGYTPVDTLAPLRKVRVLTPGLTRAALEQGFVPSVRIG